MDEDLRKMRKAELMKYAASIGVKTRKEGRRLIDPWRRHVRTVPRHGRPLGGNLRLRARPRSHPTSLSI